MSEERTPSEFPEDDAAGPDESSSDLSEDAGREEAASGDVADAPDPAQMGHPHLPAASTHDTGSESGIGQSVFTGTAGGGPVSEQPAAGVGETEPTRPGAAGDGRADVASAESAQPTSPEPSLAAADTTSSPWPIIGWLLFLASVAVVGVAAFAGLLMPAIVLDVVSFWPAWVFALLVALALWPLRRRGIARIAAVLPLLLFTWLAAAVGLHLMEWELLPSASADVDGPSAEGVTAAELEIEMDGTLSLRAGGSRLYSVSLVRTGGEVGPPDALERVLASAAAVELQERAAAGWFRSSGWNALINRGPAWDLAVVATEVDISTRGIDLRTLSVTGNGTVTVGPVAVESDVLLDGDITLVVPAAAAIEVIGTARVPAGWSESENGMASGGSGARMTVVVAEGAIAEVIEG